MRLLQRTDILSEQFATPSYLRFPSLSCATLSVLDKLFQRGWLGFPQIKCQLCPASGVYSVDHNREAFLLSVPRNETDSFRGISRQGSNPGGVGKHAKPAIHRQALTTSHGLKIEMPASAGPLVFA